STTGSQAEATEEVGPLATISEGQTAFPILDIEGGLVFVRDNTLYLGRFDGQDPVLLEEGMIPFTFELSPNRQQLFYYAFERDGRRGDNTMRVANLATATTQDLVYGPEGERDPMPFVNWSPNSRSVLLLDQEQGGGLMVVRLDEMQPPVRTEAFQFFPSAAWLSDQTFVYLFVSPDAGGQFIPGVFLFDTITQQAAFLGEFQEFALFEFLYLESVLNQWGFVYDETFTADDRAVRLPSGERVYINLPPLANNNTLPECSDWEVRQVSYPAFSPGDYEVTRQLRVLDTQQSPDAYAAQAASPELLEAAVQMADLALEPDELVAMVAVSMVDADDAEQEAGDAEDDEQVIAPLLTITVTADNAAQALTIANALAGALLDANRVVATPEQVTQADEARLEIEQLEIEVQAARDRQDELRDQLPDATDQDERSQLEDQMLAITREEIAPLNDRINELELIVNAAESPPQPLETVGVARLPVSFDGASTDVAPEDVIYQVSDITLLSDLAALPDGSLLFLRWQMPGCQGAGDETDLTVELVRLVPGQEPEVISADIDPGQSILGGFDNLLDLRGQKYNVTPDGRYIFWIGRDSELTRSSLYVTDLQADTTTELLAASVEGEDAIGFDDVAWIP
ncbi:MAG: hypothetical protein GYB65_04805, partial [Chloroflexi bacterium]|nr:hypothetical protein [Chloroflexota bacterium]